MSRSAEKLSPDKGKGDPVPSQHCTYPNPATLEKMHPLCSLNLEMPLVCPSFAAGEHPASLGGDPAGSPWVSEAISCPFQEFGHVGLFGEGQICQLWCWVLLIEVDGLPKLTEMKRLQERFSSGLGLGCTSGVPSSLPSGWLSIPKNLQCKYCSVVHTGQDLGWVFWRDAQEGGKHH